MIDLQEMFVNFFDDEKITKSRLTVFARQHLLAVEADNATSLYDDIISATEPLLTTVENCLTDRLSKEGIVRGRVQAKNLFRETLPEKIRKLFAAVAVAYGEPSSDLTICFPSGRAVFARSGCRDEDLNNHLEQLKGALTERAATVGATHVTVITNLCTQWSALFTDRWTAGAAAGMTAAGQSAAVTALQVQLYKNVHTVAIYNLGHADACNRLCPQHLLFGSTSLPVPNAPTLGSGYSGGLGVPLTATCGPNTASVKFLRRLVGEADYTEVAVDVEIDGDRIAIYTDTLPGPGHYEYVCVAVNASGESEQSNAVVALAD